MRVEVVLLREAFFPAVGSDVVDVGVQCLEALVLPSELIFF